MTLTPAKPAKPPDSPDVARQLMRIESKLVQLMKHVGMTTDGRKPLREERK